MMKKQLLKQQSDPLRQKDPFRHDAVEREVIRAEFRNALKELLNYPIQGPIPYATKNMDINIPMSIFSPKISSRIPTRRLGVLEAIVKYLREERGLNFKEISIILNRDNRALWNSYHNAAKKMQRRFSGLTTIKNSTAHSIPLSQFVHPDLSCFESAVLNLKDIYGVGLNRIAALFARNYQTIWTTYRRAKTKASYDRIKMIE